MSKRTNRYTVLSALIFCLGCGTLFAFFARKENAVQQQQLSERINLALRRTAHVLLKQAGDSTSTIAPVKKNGENTYTLQLERAFEYDSLPSFLQSSFDTYDIHEQYHVSVSDCTDDVLILGYSSLDFLKKNDIPCLGRTQTKACLDFSVTLNDPSVKWMSAPYLWLLLGGWLVFATAIMGYFVYQSASKKPSVPPLFDTPPTPIAETHLIHIGKTIFDTHNQMVLVDTIEQKLTFQESRLLELFCQHQNVLLDRDFILKAVWDDDGVLVSRSVDVFVSRLRKLLKPDDALKITNVHSRGYRFDVKNSPSV